MRPSRALAPVISILLALVVALPIAFANDARLPAAAENVEGRFDVGGRALYLRCSGFGSPTVVLEGFPFGLGEWAQVEAGVAQHGRVCVYDPVGIGLSDSPPGVRSARGLGEDLWALLDAAGVEGPYVLVGAVSGADIVQYYHRQFSDDVAGLVLVVPRSLDPAVYERFTGLVPEAEREAVRAFEDATNNPSQVDFDATWTEFIALPSGPSVPAVVIQGGIPEDVPATWPANEIDAVLKEAQAGVARALDARLVVADGTKGNWIWSERPEIVVQTIADVVAAVRNPASWQASEIASPAADVAPIDGRFDIGGRSLYLRCAGTGNPTVILEAGDGEASGLWIAVQDEVAGFTRVCSYDRAGRGLSDPAPPGVRTSADVLADLDALLATAGVPRPFVVVGSNIGTLYAQHYARLHPDAVVGLVLMGPISIDKPAWVDGDEDPLWSLVPEGEREQVLETQRAGWRGENPDRLDILASLEQIATLPLGPAVPAIVILPGLPEPFPPDWPTDEMNAVIQDGISDLAISIGAQIVPAPNAHTFDTPTAESAVVIEAIREVVEAVRNPGSWGMPGVGTPTA